MNKLISLNRKASHNYFLLDTYEAGIVLTGTEVKSIKNGNVSIKEAFINISEKEAFIENMHISPFEQGNRFNVDPLRKRKLLLHKKEILKLNKMLKQEGIGVTIIPVKIYLNNGMIKLEISFAKGKKLYDKRQSLKEKDIQRDTEKSLKRY